MLTAVKWMLGLGSGGLVLGALLGEAVDPTMKQAPEQWWELAGRRAADGPQVYGFAEAASLPMNPGGYRPDLDYDAEVWAVPLPDYDLPAFDDAAVGSLALEQSRAADQAEIAELAALEAEATAAQTIAVASNEEPAPGEPRKSDLALAGLY